MKEASSLPQSVFSVYLLVRRWSKLHLCKFKLRSLLEEKAKGFEEAVSTLQCIREDESFQEVLQEKISENRKYSFHMEKPMMQTRKRNRSLSMLTEFWNYYQAFPSVDHHEWILQQNTVENICAPLDQRNSRASWERRDMTGCWKILQEVYYLPTFILSTG